MEQGKLIIINTKKGFRGKIQFTNSKGKPAELPISVIQFKDDSLNGKACKFERDGGKLTKLVVEDQVLYPVVNKDLVKTKKPKKPQGDSSRQREQPREVVLPDSLEIGATFLPEDTKKLLKNTTVIPNFLLKFQKAARYDEQREGFTFFKKERKGESYQLKPDFQDFPFEKVARQHLESVQAQVGQAFIHQDLSVDWRMALGLGHESVYETGITLHHLYGIPYIPASSVKGVVRSWIITQVFGEAQAPDEEKKYPFHNAEYRAFQDQEFCRWFGCPADTAKVQFDSRGEVIYSNKEKKEVKTKNKKTAFGEARQGALVFYDAFPTSVPTIEPDVMNTHYQPYYTEKPINARTPPADYHDPVPIFFLTVRGCAFQFIAGAGKEKTVLEATIGGKNIAQWLTDALTHHGIGAKTAVGYGYMNNG